MANDSGKRVVVTGMGILSPLGLDTRSTWEGLGAGESGIDYNNLFNAASNNSVRDLRTQANRIFVALGDL